MSLYKGNRKRNLSLREKGFNGQKVPINSTTPSSIRKIDFQNARPPKRQNDIIFDAISWAIDNPIEESKIPSMGYERTTPAPVFIGNNIRPNKEFLYTNPGFELLDDELFFSETEDDDRCDTIFLFAHMRGKTNDYFIGFPSQTPTIKNVPQGVPESFGPGDRLEHQVVFFEQSIDNTQIKISGINMVVEDFGKGASFIGAVYEHDNWYSGNFNDYEVSDNVSVGYTNDRIISRKIGERYNWSFGTIWFMKTIGQTLLIPSRICNLTEFTRDSNDSNILQWQVPDQVYMLGVLPSHIKVDESENKISILTPANYTDKIIHIMERYNYKTLRKNLEPIYSCQPFCFEPVEIKVNRVFHEADLTNRIRTSENIEEDLSGDTKDLVGFDINFDGVGQVQGYYNKVFLITELGNLSFSINLLNPACIYEENVNDFNIVEWKLYRILDGNNTEILSTSNEDIFYYSGFAAQGEYVITCTYELFGEEKQIINKVVVDIVENISAEISIESPNFLSLPQNRNTFISGKLEKARREYEQTLQYKYYKENNILSDITHLTTDYTSIAGFDEKIIEGDAWVKVVNGTYLIAKYTGSKPIEDVRAFFELHDFKGGRKEGSKELFSDEEGEPILRNTPKPQPPFFDATLNQREEEFPPNWIPAYPVDIRDILPEPNIIPFTETTSTTGTTGQPEESWMVFYAHIDHLLHGYNDITLYLYDEDKKQIFVDHKEIITQTREENRESGGTGDCVDFKEGITPDIFLSNTSEARYEHLPHEINISTLPKVANFGECGFIHTRRLEEIFNINEASIFVDIIGRRQNTMILRGLNAGRCITFTRGTENPCAIKIHVDFLKNPADPCCTCREGRNAGPNCQEDCPDGHIGTTGRFEEECDCDDDNCEDPNNCAEGGQKSNEWIENQIQLEILQPTKPHCHVPQIDPENVDDVPCLQPPAPGIPDIDEEQVVDLQNPNNFDREPIQIEQFTDTTRRLLDNYLQELL